MAHSRLLAAFLGTVTALVAGCPSKESKCEHARDVMIGVMQEHGDRALATVPAQDRAKLEPRMKAELDHVRGVFVGECTKLDDAGMDCIGRIDEFVAVETKVRAAVEKAESECPKDEMGLTDLDCVDKARKTAQDDAKAQMKGPDCDAALGAFIAKVHEGAPE